MRFGILGPLEVHTDDGEPVGVGGPRPRALLVMLLLEAGRTVSLEHLIAGQYGDDPPAGAANAVQVQVSRLRKTVPDIEFNATGYRLVIDPDDVDALRFEALAREGHRRLVAGEHAGAAAVLTEALDLWRGQALADLPHGGALATRLDDLRLDATEDLVEAELTLPGGPNIAELRRLTRANPLRERLRGHLMRALHAAGRPAEALTEYEDLRALLAGELGTDPAPEVAAVHLAILRAERAPTRRAPAAQLTSFVGRGAELARLAELRAARLVTILGPGGIGKTRLAVESAPGAACFADLSPVDDPDAVPHAVLGALGLREAGLQAPATDPTRHLVAALDADELTIVLDNCEHVLAAAATLARTLLAECPGLRIVATSREPLGLTGETLVPLTGLDDATGLFADRAAAVRPGFALTPDNLATVTDICSRLDGLPLAIELAAARLRQFTVGELAARLTEYGPFRLLSRGDRTAAARHRTLSAVVGWSWELLGAEEQAVARRFSVFAGGAPAAAAEAVCLADDQVLADLVDRSLVETDGTRYRMLETIRLFCAQRLAESGELEAVRGRHAAYHLDLARRADPHLRAAEQLEWLATLSAEHANLMSALRWAVRAERRTALRLVATLTAYWWLSGRRGQAGEAATELLTTDVPAGYEEEYVSCVLHAMPRAAPRQWARAHEIMRSRAGAVRYPFVLAMFGMAAGPWGSVEEAEPLLGTDPWNVALGRLSTGLLGVLGGRPAEGERELDAVLAVFRGLGERWGTAQALDWLAEVAGWRGEWARAGELWADALALYERFGAAEECVDVLCRRAGCAIRQGSPDAAAADYRRAAELSARAGRPDPVAVRLGLAELARLAGRPGEARTLLDAVLTGKHDDLGVEATEARVRTALGRLAETAGEAAESWHRHREAVEATRRSPMRAELAGAVEGLAGAVLLLDGAERAALLLGVAVALRGTALTGDPDVARVAAAARDASGAQAFAKAYARGAAMPPDQALTTLDTTLTTP